MKRYRVAPCANSTPVKREVGFHRVTGLHQSPRHAEAPPRPQVCALCPCRCRLQNHKPDFKLMSIKAKFRNVSKENLTSSIVEQKYKEYITMKQRNETTFMADWLAFLRLYCLRAVEILYKLSAHLLSVFLLVLLEKVCLYLERQVSFSDNCSSYEWTFFSYLKCFTPPSRQLANAGILIVLATLTTEATDK